jgi:4-hydroxybenzoyl-CoA thioesterase
MPRATEPHEPAPDLGDWVDAAPRARAIPYASLPAAVFRTERPVRFGDCDPAGIVYTPRFIDMMNEAIERLFVHALDLDYYGLIRDGVGLGYARMGSDFFRPAAMGEVLVLAPRVGRIGGASATLIVHGFREAEEIFRGSLVMVTTSIRSAKPIQLPPQIRAALVAYQERCR